jgi:hypothetical protein
MHEIPCKIIGSRIPKKGDYKSRIDGDFELILSSKKGAKIITLNKTARKILSLCNGNNSILDISKILHEQNKGTQASLILQDIIKTIRLLEGAGILTTNI